MRKHYVQIFEFNGCKACLVVFNEINELFEQICSVLKINTSLCVFAKICGIYLYFWLGYTWIHGYTSISSYIMQLFEFVHTLSLVKPLPHQARSILLIQLQLEYFQAGRQGLHAMRYYLSLKIVFSTKYLVSFKLIWR